MRFPFNDKKTAQAAAFVLRLAGGSLNYMKLIKLLYLADREKLVKRGHTITGDTFYSMKHGPVLSRVLDFITEGPSEHPSAWFDYINPPREYDVSLREDAPEDTDEMSKFELEVLRDTFERYGRIGKWDLVDLLHRVLPEWQPTNSSIRIEPTIILRDAGWSDEEISEAVSMADELCLMTVP